MQVSRCHKCNRFIKTLLFLILKLNKFFKSKTGPCSSDSQLRLLITDFCYEGYSVINEEKTAFSPHWLRFNSSFVPLATNLNVYNSFQYSTASQLKSYPHTAVFNTYMGGGYVFKMQGNINDLSANLSLLRASNWIDKQTSALFLEFTLFNPNLNLFEYCSLTFEILPTGSIWNSAEFYSLEVFDVNNGALLSFKIIMILIYVAFIVVFMVVEIRHLVAKVTFTH